jgi:hypothetical protein
MITAGIGRQVYRDMSAIPTGAVYLIAVFDAGIVRPGEVDARIVG